jgi:hypothetical protein
MKTLMIVFDSVTGGARQMVEATGQGAAAEPEVERRLFMRTRLAPHGLCADNADGTSSASAAAVQKFAQRSQSCLT